MDKKEKLEQLRDKYAVERPSKKTVLAMAFISIVIAGSLMVLPQFIQDIDEASQPDADITIEVKDRSVEPSRPTVSSGTSVRFVNRADVELELLFDREVEGFSLEPGESKVREIESIIYYNVTSPEEPEFRMIKGGINVQ